MANVKLEVGATDWSASTLWKELKLSVRDGIGIAATIKLDVTGVAGSAPGPLDRFTLTLPTSEQFVLIPEGEPEVETYAYGATGQTVIVYVYNCIDPLSALDRLPLPKKVYIDETAGSLLQNLIPLLDSSLDVAGLEDGNTIPFLDTSKFSKFSDIVNSDEISTGKYVVIIDPSDGLTVLGDYKSNFGASGIEVDKDEADELSGFHFTPTKEPLTPDNEIINYQKVKGNPDGGPDHSVLEFRSLDVTVSTFKLAALPFGVKGAQIMSKQFEDGVISSAQNDDTDLPSAVPMRFPTVVELNDQTLDGSTGEICALKGHSGIISLSNTFTSTTIGAKVDGTNHTVTVPLAPGGLPEDDDHQYYYDWVASFKEGDLLEVRLYEYYLNNTSGSTTLATVASITDHTLTLTYEPGVTNAKIPNEVRFYTAGDPDDVLWFATVTARDTNTITIDELPTVDLTGAEVANGDSATVTQTDTVIYSGAAPASSWGQPVPQISGTGTGRAWRANHGPAIDAVLLSDVKYGVAGRRLRVAAGEASRSTDLVIQEAGDGATATWTTTFEVLRGPVKVLLNYDASKQAEYISQDLASQAVFGVRKGDDIESDLAYTVADCQAIGDKIVEEFGFPSPQGTITRESWLATTFPLPPETVWVDLPSEYNITAENVPISEVSVDFSGWDPIAEEGVVTYQITIGHLDSVEEVNRQLLARKNASGGGYIFDTSGGPRVTNASWNDTSAATFTWTGGGTLTLAGKTVSTSPATFDPAAYVTGGLKEKPVQIMGSIGGTSVVQVEVIYPPDPVDDTHYTTKYNPSTNMMTYRWGRPAGAISFIIERLQARALETDPEVWEKIDEIFTTSYPMPYEPLSQKIRVTSSGLAEKKSASVILEENLPQLAAVSLFEVVKVGARDHIRLRIGARPNKRAVKVRIYKRQDPGGVLTPPVDPDDWLTFYPDDDDSVDVEEFDAIDKVIQRKIVFEDTKDDDAIWLTAVWVDIFNQEGVGAVPFDATRPPMTLPSIDTVDFFQSATQANGGTLEDDDDTTARIEFSGTFRVHLGNHNEIIRLWFEEASATDDNTAGSWANPHIFHVPYDVTDDDAVAGYCDIPVPRMFRWARKHRHYYRPFKVVAVGPKIRERIGPDTAEEPVKEKLFLIGNDGPSFPATSPHTADGYFDKTDFEFQPGINGLSNNVTAITNLTVHDRESGMKVKWTPINDVAIRRYVVIVSENDFGTKGPGTSSTIDTALDALVGEGSLTVYRPDNATFDRTVYAIDSGLGPNHRFYNGEDVGGLTLVEGNTYYVSVIAQSKSGRWCSEFVDPVNTATGSAGAGQSPIPEDPYTPDAGHIVRSVCVGDPADGNAEVTFSIYASAGSPGTTTWGDNNVDTVSLEFTNPDDAFRLIHHAVSVDPTEANTLVTIPFKLGKSYTWTGLKVKNTVDSRSVSCSIAFTPGNGTSLSIDNAYGFDASGSILGSPALSFSSINSQHSNLTLTYTQPTLDVSSPYDTTTCPVLVKKIAFEVTYNYSAGVGATWTRIPDEDLNCLDDLSEYTTGTVSKTIVTRVKHKPNQTDMRFRATIIPFGSNFANAGSKNKLVTQGSTVNTINDLLDTAAPGSPTNVNASYKRGHLVIKADRPTTGGLNTIYEYMWEVFSGSTWLTGTSALTSGSQTFMYTGGPRLGIAIKKADISGLGTLTLRCWATNMANGVPTDSASPGSSTFAVSSMETDIPANPTTAAAAPTFIKATIGHGGLSARFAKPADARPTLQYYEYQFTNATSGSGTDYLDPDDGTVALSNTTPSGNGAAPDAGCFRAHHRFVSSDLQKRDLNTGFTNGSAQGTLQLFVRARIVDLDDTGAPRYGDWQTFNAVEHKKLVDADADQKSRGRVNLIDGGGCYTDCTVYTPTPTGTPTPTAQMIGRFMALSPSGSGTRIATPTGIVGTDSGVGAPNIYWLKDRTGPPHIGRCILVYGNTSANQLSIRLYNTIITGEVYWLTYCFAGSTGFSPGNIATALTGTVSGSLATVSVSLGAVTTSFQTMAVKFVPSGTLAGNPWLVMDFTNWSPASNELYLTNFCLTRGPDPQIWDHGRQEGGLDANNGVYLGNWGSLGSQGMGTSLNSSGITTYGIITTS